MKNYKPPLSLLHILILISLSTVAPLSTDMYLPALPSMAQNFNAPAASIQLTLTAFFIGLAVGQLLFGPLSDRFGRRKPLLIGTSVLLLAGILCSLASNATFLIMARVLQGFGGAAGVVLARAIIVDRSRTPTESVRLFQIMMMIGGLAPILAPMIGNLIISISHWRMVFVVLACMAVVSLFGVWRYLPETHPEEKRTASGFKNLLSVFKQVMSNRIYLGYALTVGFIFVALFAYISASPFLFQTIFGLTPTQYTWIFGINAFGTTLAGAVSAKLVDRIAPRTQASFGLFIMLIGVLTLTILIMIQANLWVIMPVLFFSLACCGFIFGNASALAIQQASKVAGTASAILGALQFLLGACAAPLVGIMGEHTAIPMVITMLVAIILAMLSFFGLTSVKQV